MTAAEHRSAVEGHPGTPSAAPGPQEAAQAATCVVCRRGESRVCVRCRDRVADQLAALPSLNQRLRGALVPGPGGGERVSSPRGEAQMPTRLAALTLLAGGSEDARCLFVPAVRVWTTAEPVSDADGVPRPVLTWHREPIRDAHGRPATVLADDQVGVLPVREWLRSWALEWRHAFGHSTQEPRPARALPPVTPPITARQRVELLGIAPAQEPAHRPADPVQRDWQLRWPVAGWGPVTRRAHTYLTGWLPQACDRHPYIGDFAASLRALTGAVRSALGDVDDLEYLGRCPDEITDRATGATTVCGAALWHDPFASVITCPRCHTETGQDRRIWLARRILDVWPIDRRRRYPRGLIDVLRRPSCATCSAPVTVEWVDATERADRERFWRPGNVTCPAGCEVVE